MYRKLAVLALLAIPAAPLISGTARAEEDKAELVKYRQLEMGAIARHFGATKRILKGQVNRPDDLAGHTQALVELGRDMAAQFPAGTGPDDKFETDALKKIWTDAEGFAKAVAGYEAAAKELNDAVGARDMKAADVAYTKLGDACGTCHDGFRKED